MTSYKACRDWHQRWVEKHVPLLLDPKSALEHSKDGLVSFQTQTKGEYQAVCCEECGTLNPTPFMVHDELWKGFHRDKIFLCLDCFSSYLGRPLELGDLKPMTLNAPFFYFAEQR